MTPEPKREPEKRRYLRQPKVVFVREDEGRFFVTDLNDENEYEISKEVFKRDYQEI